MTTTSTITVALANFNDLEMPEMKAVFMYAERWAQPWKLVEQSANVQVILYRIYTDKDLKQLHTLATTQPKIRFIAYAQNDPQNACWHLQPHPNGRLSLLRFNQILREVCLSIENKLFNHFEVSPLGAQDSNTLIPFIDKITALLDSSGWEKKKRFNDHQ